MEINEILVDVQKRLKAPKGQKNTFGNYNYRSCEDIVEAVKPLLHEHGASLRIGDDLVNIGNRYYVKATACIHKGDQSICETAFAREAESKKGMDESQITGAASSYSRKYALNGLFAIDDTKDADTQDNRTHIDGPLTAKEKEKLPKAIQYYKDLIDSPDDSRELLAEAKEKWNALSQTMQNAIQDGMGTGKAPDSNRMYKTLLKDYLK